MEAELERVRAERDSFLAALLQYQGIQGAAIPKHLVPTTEPIKRKPHLSFHQWQERMARIDLEARQVKQA